MERNTESASDYVWSTSEASRQQILILCAVRTIVERYGGTMETDPRNKTFSIDVPEEEAVACAVEIEAAIENFPRLPGLA